MTGSLDALFATLGMTILGGVIAGLGWLLLGEYRKAFFRDPRAVMTLEVFTRASGVAGPGYMAMLLLAAGTIFILVGLAGSVTVIGAYIWYVFSLIGKS